MSKQKKFNKNKMKHNQRIKSKLGNEYFAVKNEKDGLTEDKLTDKGMERIAASPLLSNIKNFEIIKDASLEKMSEVLLDFAKPLFDNIDTDDRVLYERAVQISIIIWNYSIIRKSIIDSLRYQEAVRSLKKVFGDKEGKMILSIMLDRKQALYPDNKRLIMHYDIMDAEDHWHLTVASTMPK